MQQHIFRDPATGEAVVMPVSPGGHSIEQGRKVSVIAMHTVGEIAQPAERVVLDEELTYLLPARDYSFCNPGAVLDPYYYIEKFAAWSTAGTVLRWIITDTPINLPVLLGPIQHEHREDDQSGDLYMTVPLVGCPPLEAVTREATGNKSRASDEESTVGGTYIVVRGDTLGGICRRFYGDASLYLRLAAANGIKNPHLIHPGQVLKIPPLKSLPKASGTISKSASIAKNVMVSKPESPGGRWRIWIDPKVARA